MMNSTIQQASPATGRRCSTPAIDERSRWLGILACGALAGWGMKSGAILQTLAGAAGGIFLATIGRSNQSGAFGVFDSGREQRETVSGAESPAASLASSPPRQSLEESITPAGRLDPVDEASMESFPCSDPPAFTGETATPSCLSRFEVCEPAGTLAVPATTSLLPAGDKISG